AGSGVQFAVLLLDPEDAGSERGGLGTPDPLLPDRLAPAGCGAGGLLAGSRRVAINGLPVAGQRAEPGSSAGVDGFGAQHRSRVPDGRPSAPPEQCTLSAAARTRETGGPPDALRLRQKGGGYALSRSAEGVGRCGGTRWRPSLRWRLSGAGETGAGSRQG